MYFQLLKRHARRFAFFPVVMLSLDSRLLDLVIIHP